MNLISTAKAVEIAELYRGGLSIRAVAVEAGIAVRTAARYRPDGLICPCGKQAGHPEWCAWRISLSPRRQAYLEQCRVKTALRLATVHERLDPVLTTWPFVRSFDNDEYQVMAIVNSWLPRSLPESIRADAGQEALLDILSGTSLEDARAKVNLYIKEAYRFVPSKFSVSLDAPMRFRDGDGHTLADCISAEDYAERLADAWAANRLISTPQRTYGTRMSRCKTEDHRLKTADTRRVSIVRH